MTEFYWKKSFLLFGKSQFSLEELFLVHRDDYFALSDSKQQLGIGQEFIIDFSKAELMSDVKMTLNGEVQVPFDLGGKVLKYLGKDRGFISRI